MVDKKMLIAAQIRARREYLDMTQADLANLIGVTPEAINNYEKGKRSISSVDLPRFAEVLGVTIGYFYDDPMERDHAADDEVPILVALYEGLPVDERDELLQYARFKAEQARKAATTHGKKAE